MPSISLINLNIALTMAVNDLSERFVTKILAWIYNSEGNLTYDMTFNILTIYYDSNRCLRL